MRTNLENSILYAPRMFGAKHGYVRFLLQGTFMVTQEGPTMYFLDPGISDRDVILPPISTDAGQFFHISNIGTSGRLNVKDNGGVAVISVPPQRMGLFVSYVGGWFGVTTASTSSAILAPVQRNVVFSPIVISNSDEVINCNISFGSPICTLPASAMRAGTPLRFTDVAGNFQAHPLTISAPGGQTISGLASVVLGTNYSSVQFRPYNDGVNSGWSIEG